ncbi:hypothetical protein VE01_09294 [Pseudogymnoascus verrucosus]|uniref:Aminodeoxychorismate lyase n=1 Tax=Pseudogymnoascus verrucosus TaxID=342668 RepID=A0A1B8G999_9PEZI|nr:uncharacterized protein VE01_09294 [Pseudogymnoascus verrucosus]OBT92397.1 hypothetical protein VE01_09294 [Pseudogymnoascus verrucosus]
MSAPEPTFDLFTSLRYDPLLLTCAANTTLSPSPSPFYMLSHHRDRILSAAQHFNWPLAIARLSGPSGLDHFLAALKDAVDTTSTAPRRVRAVVDREGGISVDSFEIPKRPLRNLFPTRLPPPGTGPPRVNPLTGGALTLGDDDSTVQQGPGYGEPSREQAWSVMLDPVDTSPSPLTSYKTTSRDMYNSARTRVGIESMSDPKEVLICSTKEGEIMEGSLTTVLFWRGGTWVTPPVESGGQVGTTRRWALENGLCVEEVVRRGEVVDGEECWVSNGVRGFIAGVIKL